jgi:hypothetical protein
MGLFKKKTRAEDPRPEPSVPEVAPTVPSPFPAPSTPSDSLVLRLPAQEFSPDSDLDGLFTAISDFSFLEVTGRIDFVQGEYPPEWHEPFQEALQLKRTGSFQRSGEILISLMTDSGKAYLGVYNSLYKVEASAGLIASAYQRLFGMTQRMPPEIAEYYQDHLERLTAAVPSEDALRDYLSAVCGNPNYYIHFDYPMAVERFNKVVEGYKDFM